MADRLQALRDALAAHPGEPVSFDQLVAEVWQGDPPKHPRAALRTLVQRLRATERVITEPSGYRLVARPPAPCQLPADLPDFVGRKEEFAKLRELDAPVRVITGLPGVGKTALAVREAYRLREQFPDGQLYVNLRGYSTGPSMTVEQALARFVKVLGGGPEDDYRALLRNRRVLVVLDNATEDVIAPLLPEEPGCAALITSRAEMPKFPQVNLGVLADLEARELLERMRVDGDTNELIELCARLPLALRIAGANLAGRHLPDYVAELREHRLEALEIEEDDTAVRAAFDLSYRKLSERARRTFDFLGAVPGPDIPRTLVGDTIDELVVANLVQSNGNDRYQLHDLLRLYAHSRATPQDRRTVFDWYLARADGADAALNAGFTRLLPPVPEAVPFADEHEAQAWFEAERLNLVALAEDQPDAALVAALRAHLSLTGPFADLRSIARAALARETGQRAAAMRVCLGYLDYRFGDHRSAIEHCERAIAEFRAAGRQAEESVALNMLAGAYHSLGELDLARRHLGAAIELYLANDLKPNLIGGLGNLGLLELELGNLDAAEKTQRRSIGLAREMDYVSQLANQLGNLATVLTARKKFAEAEEAFREALELAGRHGLRPIEMFVLVEFAELFATTGRRDEARDHALRALEMAGQDNPFIEVNARLVLAGLHRSIAEYDDVHRRAADAEFRLLEVLALAGKAALLRENGDVEAANTLCHKAIERAEAAGFRYRADLVRAQLK